jgi:PKD repeat protein
MVNEAKWGGTGGTYAVLSNHESVTDLLAHELGHAFGKLADEYWAGPQYARERPNMTRNRDPATVTWKNFLNRNGVGIYAHEEFKSWFRPHQNCKMRDVGNSFCDVCSFELEQRLLSLSDTGYSEQPIALFGANALRILPSEKVKFFDLTTNNPSSWEWTFEGGNPEFSTEKNPEVIYHNQGKYKVTLKAFNRLGENEFSREKFINVISPLPDQTPPFILTKKMNLELDENGQATISWEEVDDGTYDDDEISEISISKGKFICEDIGNNIIIFKAKDLSGNESKTEVSITVEDNAKPIIKAKNIQIYIDSEGIATLDPKDVDDGSFDNCEIKEMILSQTKFTKMDEGANKVLFTVNDFYNNSASVEITVTVEILQFGTDEILEGLKIYPNPANDIVFIEYLKLIDPQLESIQIIDIQGRILNENRVFERKGKIIPIELKELRSGQYFIRLHSKNTMKILRFNIQK